MFCIYFMMNDVTIRWKYTRNHCHVTRHFRHPSPKQSLPMKLLCLTHYADLLGANRSLLHLLSGLPKAVQVQVWCPREGAFCAELRKRGIDVQVVPFANWAYTVRSRGFWLFGWRWWQHQRQLPDFLAQAAAFAPDIIHSNSSVVVLGAQLAERLRVPHVWHIREYGWADYQLFFLLGAAAKKRYFAQATTFIAISESIKNTVLANVKNVPTPIIYNGVGKLAYLQTLPIAQTIEKQHFTFLIIGLLHPAKNQLQAIRAFRIVQKKYPNTRLVIVGTGRKMYELRLRLCAKIWGLSNCIAFRGYVADPTAVYRAADAVLMCSPNEAMGRVTAEAMAYAKPVIGCNSGATPELITPMHNGLLYNGTDTDLAAQMIWLLQNPDLAAEIARNAHQYVLQKFSDEKYVAQVYELLQAIV
jgi:glycosyltransferase involved in cell wall biosynthesis